MKAVIQGIAHAVPNKVLSNADLEKMVDTSDEWIMHRSGIKERRMCSPDETTATLATEACQKLLQKTGFDPKDVELIIVGTVTGDFLFPSVSSLVQDAIGAHHAGAMDVGAACAGFIYALCTASAMIENGSVKNAIVVGADALTKFVDWTDRSTCVLFGDGAAAVLMQGEESGDRGVLKTFLKSDGSGAKYIDIQVGGNRYPAGSNQACNMRTKIYMAGSEVYRFAVIAMGDACCRVLDLAGMKAEDIDLFVPHQANLRIIDAASDRLGLPREKVFVNVEKYGNTSAASIPIALSEAEEQGRLKRGMTVMTVGFGAGLVWGANIIRW